jgi:uncharacterized protein (TIGR00369 family)
MPDSPANPDYAAHVRNAVLSMPAAQLFGFDFTRIEPGSTELTLPYRDALSFRPGFFQGAIVGSLADFAGASAAGTLLAKGWFVATVDYDVRIIAPAQGDRLIARGRVVKPGATLSFAQADVFVVRDGRETQCAMAFVTTRNFEVKSPS